MSDEERIEAERAALTRGGRLHWVHWVVVVASLGLTVLAWSVSKRQIEGKAAARFEREAERTVELIRERMELYENALWAGASAIQANGGDVDYAQWLTFSESLSIGQRYPGINGIGVIDHLPVSELGAYVARQRANRPDFRVHPPHDQPELWPIRLVEPVATNAAAVGLDMAHERNRRTAAQRARSTGTAQITGPIVLVQDAEKTPGFLFYAPYYERTAEERTPESFVGLVYAPFIVDKLMEGALRRETRHIGLRITDRETVIYDEHLPSAPGFDPEPLFTSEIPVELYGRTWLFDVRSDQFFRGAASSGQPAMILGGGIFIDSLLLTLFVLLTRSNRRAIDFADSVTHELRVRRAELERSNEELERFAYVASHDLKTPLRGIGDLTEYLEEDLGDHDHPDVHRNLGRLRTQVDRMNSLIRGVLEYASLNTSSHSVAELDLADLVASTARDLGLDDSRVRFEGEPRRLLTDAVQLGQVVTNLLTNAVKHHHAPESADLRVTLRDDGDRYQIAVCDDGPGIDPRFHERIFQPFQTLQSKDVVDSTGIGLAIVKKMVEGVGGTIDVRSAPGEGSTFVFTWPKEIEQTPQA